MKEKIIKWIDFAIRCLEKAKEILGYLPEKE